MFFVAFLPEFIDVAANVNQQLWILALTFLGLAILNTTLYAFLATEAQRHLVSKRTQRAFNLTGGGFG